MPEEILANARIDQLPLNSQLKPGMWGVVRNIETVKTERFDIGQLLTSPTSGNFTWLSDTPYLIDQPVIWNGKWWIAVQNSENVIPGTNVLIWQEINKSPSGFVFWQAGVFAEDNVFVLYDVDQNPANPNFQMFYLLDPARPYVSSNFATELAAGDWDLLFSSPAIPIVSDTFTNALEKLAGVVKWKGPLIEDTLISGDYRMMFLNKLFDLSTTGNLIKFYGQGEANYKPVDLTTGSGFAGDSFINGNIRGIAEDTDGKLVLVGRFNSYNGVTNNRIIRLNRNGSVDTSFLTGTAFSDAADIHDVKQQSTGKYIIIGSFGIYNGTAKTGIVRLNQDGTIDNTFISGTGLLGGAPLSLAIQADDKIIVGGGHTTYNGTSCPGIVRIEADGAIDTTFDANSGSGFNKIGGFSVTRVAVGPNGKIVCIGAFTTYNGVARSKIARLNSDGTLDTLIVGTGLNIGPSAMAIQSDNKVVLGGGFTSYNGTTVNKMVRLNEDGTIDNTFVNGNEATNIFNISVTPDGKILAVISYTFGAIQNKGIVLLTSTGALDSTFNPATTGFNESVYVARQLNNGDIAAAGIFTTFNGETFNRLIGFTTRPILLAKAPLGITYEDNYTFTEARSLPDVGYVQSEFGVFETVFINSINQLTLDMQYLGRPSGEKNFIINEIRATDFSIINFINSSNLRKFTFHIPITGTVAITLPSGVIMEEEDTRWNNATKVLTLVGGTASPFELKFTKIASIYKLEASSKYYSS